MRIFRILLSTEISNPKILVFISTKNNLIWGSEMRKIKLQKIVGNLLDKLRKLYMNGPAI